MDEKALAYLGDQGPFYQALTGNLHHIRVLEVHDMTGDVLKRIVAMNQETEAGGTGEAVGATAVATMKGCTRLRRLEAFSEERTVDMYSGEYMTRHRLVQRRKCFLDFRSDALYLLRRNSSLTVLHLPSEMLTSPVTNKDLLGVLRTGLLQLESLQLESQSFKRQNRLGQRLVLLQAALPFLQASLSLCSLKELKCHFSVHVIRDQGPGALVQEAFGTVDWTSWQEPSRSIKSLTLPFRLPVEIKTHVLRNCVPNLTKLRVQPPITPEFLEALEAHPTGIQHLLVNNFDGIQTISDQVPEILRACKGTTRGDGLGGLKSLSIDHLYNGEAVVSEILKHSGTLEELTLTMPMRITSPAIQRILSGCSELTRLSVSRSLLDERGLVFQDVLETPWVCTKLKFLRLSLSTLAVRVAHLNPEEVEAFRQDCTRQVFGRIGDLKDLEELELEFKFSKRGDGSGCSRHIIRPVLMADLQLKQLRGIKKLRRLMISPEIRISMGQAEVEFLAREWPALEEVEFDTCEKKKYWETVELDHWCWLKKNRPDLRLKCEGT